MFETPKSGNKTSSGKLGLNIRTLASPEVGLNQVSGEVNVPFKCPMETIFSNVKFSNKSLQGTGHEF